MPKSCAFWEAMPSEINIKRNVVGRSLEVEAISNMNRILNTLKLYFMCISIIK